MSKRVSVGILGAGGFTGQELIRIFTAHPYVELKYLTSTEYAGRDLVSAFPALVTAQNQNLKFSPHPRTVDDAGKLDAVFLATPDDVALYWAPQFLKAGIRVIDISGAFRLHNTAQFKQYYGIDHSEPALLKQAVYGLTEIYRDAIRHAQLIANPGCYPTAALLPLYAYRNCIDSARPIIIDAKSGTSGAGGRKEKDGLGFSTVYENFRAYKVMNHQHAPEIEQELSLIMNNSVSLRFTPHLLPLYRGIYCSTYAFLRPGVSDTECVRSAQSFATEEPFIRYRENPNEIELRSVQRTNFCDFSHCIDEKNGLIQIVSAIDNLMKGAAGQAVQNMNLMFALPEEAGVC